MEISYDPAKREWTLRERGLDFAETPIVFGGRTFTALDDRHDYGEERRITVGLLRGRMVVIVWTPRDEGRHIISFRKANDREETKYQSRLG
ncbi:MAG: BrnT family toxin [Alphaproteobacteria bacterium]|nr:BrnT family toxin [Alphaproteobacteria bacterium]MBV9693008.1 BrnT family toxin [Alphaproteobacteria bacterium]